MSKIGLKFDQKDQKKNAWRLKENKVDCEIWQTEAVIVGDFIKT